MFLRASTLLAVVVIAAILAGCGGDSATAGAAANTADPGLGPIPTRKARARAVEPVAGESAAYADLPTEQPGDQPTRRGAAAPGPRALSRNRGPTGDAAISNAEVLKNGIALPPIEAPEAVRQIIEAGNQIARTPYLWGGGHGKWLDKGYDCSGSISFALASAGLLGGPLDSGRLMGWGAQGKGKWITIYSNPGHVYMVVAGVRFDTSGTRSTGSRWQSDMRGGGGFVARHPAGL
ncbi:MAG: peptidoglycan DL-endopeptidase RipB [Solirubrobacteraceae bacterium]|nr:peptidoglycan DL-endopeptidase RipB [Solirubrobacteraceae bacterium]MEA2183184.1 peptidoglycan DL-endopeptidase RipB [Solirubrobacteraceae bacterium]